MRKRGGRRHVQGAADVAAYYADRERIAREEAARAAARGMEQWEIDWAATRGLEQREVGADSLARRNSAAAALVAHHAA